jgi:hypothetical protein
VVQRLGLVVDQRLQRGPIVANILLKIGKGIEVAAEDVIKWDKDAANYLVRVSPTALAALAVLLAGVEKAATDAATDATNPLTILLTGHAQIADFLAVWPELKAFAVTLGITKL